MSDGLNTFFNSLSGELGKSFGNPFVQKKPTLNVGLTRTPFLAPDPTLLLSSVYISTGISRTNLANNQVSQSPLISVQGRNRFGLTSSFSPGFTPISYYRTSTGEVKIVTNYLNYRKTETAIETSDNDMKIADERMVNFKTSLSDYVEFISSKNDLETSDGSTPNDQTPYRLLNYIGTPFDNEDPVYFSFEFIIRVDSSPIFNGDAESFINKIGGSYDEVNSRREILSKFQNEIQKYFKLDSSLSSSTSINRRYYLKKVVGLDKLVESNQSGTRKSFVDYGKDILTLTFYEDTTLNLGYLASLYKLLYWSRLRGKSMLPENLLRFDCEIIVSELRNFVRARKTSVNTLEYFKSNLSRYRYELYECQLFFNKMSHPDSIDLSEAPKVSDSYDVEMSFKYSNMTFERYDGNWQQLRNSTVNPNAIPQNSVDFENNTRQGESFIYPGVLDPRETSIGVENRLTNVTETPFDTNNSDEFTVEKFEQNEKINIYNLINIPTPEFDNSRQNPDIFGKAADKLIQNLKTSALNSAQRQLNIQFRLLNNSLDKIRNSFGIGRMPAPKNVYFPTQNNGPYGNSQFFFDVQNSLRNFGGDVLGGLIGL